MFSTSNVKICLFKNFTERNQTRPSFRKTSELLYPKVEVPESDCSFARRFTGLYSYSSPSAPGPADCVSAIRMFMFSSHYF